ncbi:Ubiquitin receptor RAD23d (AtRAD23d) (Putative DNA repair protein RAD23-4) (RAD23-like protein 4) (AtRAD23-4), partial [Durusdinium trenchii]
VLAGLAQLVQIRGNVASFGTRSMKLQVRPLKGETFDLEVEPVWTIKAVKEAIAATKPELPTELQKVLHKGKVLQDADTLQDVGIVDGDFVVIMMGKAKQAEAPAAPAAPAPAAPAAPAPEAAAAPAAPPPAPAEDETAVQNLCEMGFPRELVRQCLRAAFNNADRAVEYLMSGIPPHLQHLADGSAPAPAPAPPAPVPAPPVVPPAPGQMPQQPSRPLIPAPETGPLAPLANHPKFNALRQAVQQHPSTLNQVLTVIAKGDPEMIKLIAEHQDEFVRLLSQPPTADPIAAMLQAAQARGAQPARPPQLGAGDEEAIQRLEALGFPRRACVEAYLSCDRNEELAANYLFDRMEE